jgi:hypothetical protein
MDICTLPVADKRHMARRVGQDLTLHHGKKRHYTPKEIRQSARRLNFPDIWDCWALSLYASAPDFADYHAGTGESCDYASMHAAMVEAVATDSVLPDTLQLAVTAANEGSWFSDLMDVLGSSDIDFPDIDV